MDNRKLFQARLKSRAKQQEQKESAEAKPYKTASILDKATGKKQFPVLITQRIDEKGLETYKIYLDKDKGVEKENYLGYMELSTEKMQKFAALSQKDEEEQPSLLWINRLDTLKKAKDNYTGIGTCLFQIAVQRSHEKGCKGRVGTEALYNLPGFYHRMGLRSADAKINEEISKELKKAKEENRDPRLEGWGGFMFTLGKQGKTD